MGILKTIIKQSIKNSRLNSIRQQRNELINNNKSTVEKIINDEIHLFLKSKRKVNYVFNDKEIEQKMKLALISLIVDLRNDLYNFKMSYIHKSPKKMKEIKETINYYYELDKSLN